MLRVNSIFSMASQRERGRWKQAPGSACGPGVGLRARGRRPPARLPRHVHDGTARALASFHVDTHPQAGSFPTDTSRSGTGGTSGCHLSMA